MESWLEKRTISELKEYIKPKCGNCFHWITARCPRRQRKGLTGRYHEPTMNASPCQSYEQSWATAKADRMITIKIMKGQS